MDQYSLMKQILLEKIKQVNIKVKDLVPLITLLDLGGIKMVISMKANFRMERWMEIMVE